MKIGVKVNSGIKGFIKQVDNIIAGRSTAAAEKLQSKIRAKFSRPSRQKDASRPGTYPKYINKHALNSIRVRKVVGKNAIEVVTVGPRKHRIPMLSTDVTISPKGKSLAIPLSWAAKRHSSNGKGPRSFKPGGKEMHVIVLGRRGDTKVFLGTEKKGISKTGVKHSLHYLLSRKPIKRKARKGVQNAFDAEISWLSKLITEPVDPPGAGGFGVGGSG
tara:strand:+ start:8771 stop:9421 length:651 start_codon:yes stop_codon:yes gene_type:complete